MLVAGKHSAVNDAHSTAGATGAAIATRPQFVTVRAHAMLPRSVHGPLFALTTAGFLLLSGGPHLAGAQPLEGGPLEGGPIGGEPVSGGPVWDPPIGGAPVYGAPVGEGQPIGGADVSGAPVEENQPIGGAEVSGKAVEEGEPINGPDVSGEPVEEDQPLGGAEVSGEAVGERPQGAPVYGVPGWDPPVGGAPVYVAE